MLIFEMDTLNHYYYDNILGFSVIFLQGDNAYVIGKTQSLATIACSVTVWPYRVRVENSSTTPWRALEFEKKNNFNFLQKLKFGTFCSTVSST